MGSDVSSGHRAAGACSCGTPPSAVASSTCGAAVLVVPFVHPHPSCFRSGGLMRKLGIRVFLFSFVLQALTFAHAANATPKVQLKAIPLPLSDVRLTGGPLKKAQDLDAAYLLELQPERMLAFLRQRAGLDPEAQGYGGWDGPGRQLTGHIAGHYLSAVSMMYASTGDIRFKQRADALVTELQDIQNAQDDGYIGALLDAKGVDGKVRFQDLSKGEIKSGGFDLNGLWSPWYVEHKLFAGLRDAYHLTGNRTALDVERSEER